mgnify:CR=1 FL=1
MSNCKICKAREIRSNQISVDLPTFAHSNFKLINKSSKYKICKNCGLISVLPNRNSLKFLKSLSSKKYIYSNQSDQIKSFKKKSLKTREELQYNYLKKYLNKKNFNLLDIGCFNGKLIKIIKRYNYKNNIFAYDTNKYLRKFFKESNIKFSNKLNFNKIFDYIIISHSLQYIPNIQYFFQKIEKIINNETLIFIQLPNLNKNIFNHSFGDQYYLFSKEFLYNLSYKFNFKVIKFEENYFSNEILMVIKKNDIISKKITKIKKINSFIKLKKIKNKLKRLEGKFYVFGTSINSAFINSYLKERNLGFVDENPKKKIFINKMVFLPSSLKKSVKIIFTYNGNNSLKKRLKRRFSKNLISI